MKKIYLVSVILVCSLIGRSQVSFVKNQMISIGANPWSAMVDHGDMDNDGNQEVVAMYLTQGNDMKLGIYKVNADSTITTSTTYVLKSSVNSNFAMRNFIVLNANIQTDNRKDIAYVHSDSVTILFQKYDGSFSLDSSVTMFSGATADGIARGDFNNDGRDDFATTNWNDTHITVYLQTLGGFYVSNVAQAGYNQIKIADVNGDGYDDMCFLAGQGPYSGVYVYENDMTGYFTTTPLYIPLTDPNTGLNVITNSFSVGNFLGLGTELFLSPSISTLNCDLFSSMGTVDQTLTIPPFGKTSAAADFNADGKDELVALTNASSERLMVVEFTPTLTIHSYPSQVSGNYHALDQTITCADVVGTNGKIDIVTISDEGFITIWENTLLTLPAIFNVTGGGYICTTTGFGTTPLIGLDGSEVGVNYELWLSGTLQTVEVGTGTALWFDPISSLGTYTVIAQNNDGSSTMAGSALIFPAWGFTLDLGPDTVTIAPGETDTLTAIVDDEVSFLWSTGDTTQSIIVSTAGWYYVTATGICDILTDSVYIDVVTTTAIQTISDTRIIHIYPNPATDYITIDLPPTSRHEITIIDMTGKVVYQRMYERSIDVSSFSKGVYTVYIKGEETMHVQKIIK